MNRNTKVDESIKATRSAGKNIDEILDDEKMSMHGRMILINLITNNLRCYLEMIGSHARIDSLPIGSIGGRELTQEEQNAIRTLKNKKTVTGFDILKAVDADFAKKIERAVNIDSPELMGLKFKKVKKGEIIYTRNKSLPTAKKVLSGKI